MCREDRCNPKSNSNGNNDADSTKVLKLLIDLQNRCTATTTTTSTLSSKQNALYDIAHELLTLLSTSQSVAMARMVSLNHDISNNHYHLRREGISFSLVNYLLKEAVENFLSSIPTTHRHTSTSASTESSMVSRNETRLLCKVLQLHLHVTGLDMTLSEEMAKCGSHSFLSKLIFLDSSSIIETMYGSKDDTDCIADEQREIMEQDEDILTEIQDLACEIAHDLRLPHLSFPVKVSPFTTEELINRLPLEFHVQSPYYHNSIGVNINANIDNDSGMNNDINSLSDKGRSGFGIKADSTDNNSNVSKFMSFLVQQVTDRQSAQEDVGFVMWPSAVVLSSWLLENPHVLYNKDIIELGAGCGLTGLVASRIVAEYQQQYQQQDGIIEEEKKCDGHGHNLNDNLDHNMTSRKKVIMTDFNAKVLTNLDRNIELNKLSHVATTSQLDFYLQSGSNYEGGWVAEQELGLQSGSGVTQAPVDLILAADVICKPSDSVAASKTIYDVLKPGGEAIIISANAKHRFGVDIFESECESVGLEVKVIDVSDLCDGKLLPKTEESDDPCGIRQTSGFVDGMTLTMFQIKKPCQ